MRREGRIGRKRKAILCCLILERHLLHRRILRLHILGESMPKKKKRDPLADIPYAEIGKHGVRLELDLSKRAPEKPKNEANMMYR